MSTPDGPIRVLLVEDNDVYRDSLVFLLGARAELEVVGAEGTGEGAIRRARELEPDVSVVDFRLPDIDGADGSREPRERGGLPERLRGRGRVRCRVERGRRARAEG